MNVSRIAILGVALVAGIAAFFLMLNNGSSISPIQIVEPVKEKTVRVLIAGRNIERGERISADDTNWVAWPKAAVQPTFITDETPEKREEIQNAVARALVVAGEPIVEAKLVRAGQSGLMAAIITPGYRAVTMRVSPETSSGGFILPGDRVDILHTNGRDEDARTKLLFEEVRILAVNTIYSEAPETPNIDGVNVTVELSPSDAEAFVTARSSGILSLVLRSIFKPEGELQASGKRSSDVSVIRYGRS